MGSTEQQYVGFVGTCLVGRGALVDVVRSLKKRDVEGTDQRVAVFDEATGRTVEIDLRGDVDDAVARLAPVQTDPAAPEATRGPGRPKLGVVSREVSLLPRHWAWLADQRGGASAALRRLVEAASKANASEDAARRAVDAAHRFMWDMAGNLPGFEDATRALFAHDFDALHGLTAAWPSGIREQLRRFTDRATDARS